MTPSADSVPITPAAPESMTVLVVEDEVIVRMVLSDHLAAAGYTVLEAGNAAHAIAILESHPEIRLVFTDVDMPGSMDGVALSHYVRGRWPPVSLVVTSGHHLISAGQLPTGSRFVAKPYSYEAVVDTIGELTRI